MKQLNGAARLSPERSFRGALTKQADRCVKDRREGLYSVSGPGKRQWVATQQPVGNARLAAAAISCDEAAERRPAGPPKTLSGPKTNQHH